MNINQGARLRVVVGAAACGPCEEPEANAGWAFATAAAKSHDVWVITRPRFRREIEAAIDADPALAAHLRFSYLDLSESLIRLRRHSWDLYWYYALWQHALGKRARELHERVGFNVAHHITFANDWLPCGLTVLPDVPLVWGPVGGSSRVPVARVSRWLGARGIVSELLRSLLTGALRRWWGERAARRAALVVAQNSDVANRFASAARVIVEPNASLEVGPIQAPRPSGPAPVAIFAGRLVGWKGARLALATIAHPLAEQWSLRIFGDGYERRSLERRAVELGVADRVEFLGQRPRAELRTAYATADAFLFPSFHDQAGWVVAEATSAGIPVVCLPLGGPPLLAGPNARVASLSGDVVENLAQQLVSAKGSGVPYNRWSRQRLPCLVDRWYATAIGTATPKAGPHHG